MKNKKGMLGFDTVKAVILALMTLAVLVIVMFVVIVPLRTSVENVDTGTSAATANETVAITDTSVSLSAITLRNVVCTVTQILNTTNNIPIALANITQTNSSRCVVHNATAVTAAFITTPWRISYTYIYDSPYTNELVENLTLSPRNFFSNVPTFFTLLGVVVLILIISIVIIAVTRFSPGAGSFSAGSSEGSGSLENI